MNRITHYLRWLPLLTILFVASGCTSEEQPDQRKASRQGLTFTLETPVEKENIGTRAMNAAAEQTISSLDVLVFKEVAPNQEIFDYKISVPVSSITGGTPRSFTANVNLQSTRQRFVLIANAADLVNTLSAAGQAKDDVLDALIIRQPNKWNAASPTNFDAIPMWGETGLMTINSSGLSTATIYLHRMMAKINVAIAPAIPTTTFSLNEVYLYNRNTRGHLVPNLLPANWNPLTNNGEALNPTLPIDNIPGDPLIIFSPTWKYDNTDGVTATGIANTIYTFETKADNTDPLKEFALVVGGRYNGSATTTYYRVDFKDTAPTPNYIDILRNHNYTITINAVGGAGAGTPDDAYNGSVTLDATVTVWNLANQSSMIDPTNTLELDSTVAVIPYNVGGVLNFGIRSANSWTISMTNLTNAIATQSTTTLNITATSTNPNNANERGCGWIDITMANFKYKLIVNQSPNPEYYPSPHNGWAGSNIYWDGSKLTFDDVNDQTHCNYQGLFFQWGGLTGIAPNGNVNSNWNTSILVYKPGASTGVAGGAWDSWLRVNDATITSSPPAGKTERDRHYLYEIHDPSNGIGDICRYITEQAGGTLHGKTWRMPTLSEFDGSYSRSGSWTGVASSSNTGTFVNSNAPGYTKSAVGSPFFPAAGYRHSTLGRLFSVGGYGYYWAGSPTGTNGYYLYFGSGGVNPNYNTYRAYGFSVRCVQE